MMENKELSSILLSLGLSLLMVSGIIPEQGVNSQGKYDAYLPILMRNGSWVEVGTDSATGGGISNTGSFSYDPALAVAPDGTPFAAWSESISINTHIYVRGWNGITWAEVGDGSASGGGISNLAGGSGSPSIAIAPDGTIYVAWEYRTRPSSENSEIFIRRWNGKAWVEVGEGSAHGGGISNNGSWSIFPSLAIATDGTPYVAWQDYSSGHYEIYIRRWDGNQWVEVGNGSASGGGISNQFIVQNPALAISIDGFPCVAWDSGFFTGNSNIFVKCWDGDAWIQMGDDDSLTFFGLAPSLDIAPDGTIFIAWMDFSLSDEHEIYVRRWDGSQWVEVGSGSASGGGISNSPNNNSSTTSLKIAPDGKVYVAWVEYGITGIYSDIYIRRWDGSNWQEVKTGSATGGGISNNSGWSVGSSLTIAADGNVYLGWADDSSSIYEIYVLRYFE